MPKLRGPAQALRFQISGFGVRALVGLGRRAVRLAEGVAAGDERDGFLVVHGHALEGLADILGGRDRIGVAVGTFRVDVDQAHLRPRRAGFPDRARRNSG